MSLPRLPSLLPALFISALLSTPSARAGLPEYVSMPDPSFSWDVNRVVETELGSVHHIDLTSQTWRDIPWTHQFRIYEPKDYSSKNVMLLFITGGSSTSKHRPGDDLQAFALARACDCRVAVLPQVPNQPLLGGRTEDDLISETFVNYLETGEEDWPLLQPMVKSAVRAMDAAQAWGSRRDQPVSRFVVTGASKRGWTTWLTGAVDDRVEAIAPMVIPTLNMKENTENQLELWGAYSDQIEDYTRRGLTETFDTPDGSKLWRMVDPYFYLDRIDIPILQINGSNDPYWTHDSMRFYWNTISSPHRVVYLPNAGHGLEEHREYAINGVGALVRHVAAGQTLPNFSWHASGAEHVRFAVDFPADHAPKDVTFWMARSDDRDFRDERWAATSVEGVDLDRSDARGTAILQFDRPTSGSVAVFADLTYEIDGLEYHLTTPIHEFRPDPAEDLSGGDARP